VRTRIPRLSPGNHGSSGSEGAPELALWRVEGDRFIYLNDSALRLIRATVGIDYRRTLEQIIRDNRAA
jgi:hypothetical protein